MTGEIGKSGKLAPSCLQACPCVTEAFQIPTVTQQLQCHLDASKNEELSDPETSFVLKWTHQQCRIHPHAKAGQLRWHTCGSQGWRLLQEGQCPAI